jgi:hypothetical protein
MSYDIENTWKVNNLMKHHLPIGERSDRARAILVRGDRPLKVWSGTPSPGMYAASRAHSDLSPPGRGEEPLRPHAQATHTRGLSGTCSSRRTFRRATS